MLVGVGTWVTGEVLGFDFETTGIDRFSDVPVSYALVHAVAGRILVSWSGIIDPGRAIPEEATAVHGITTARARAEGMPLNEAIGLVSDAVVSAGLRGVPLVGMKLDYDLTILEVQARRLIGIGIVGRRWRGPVLDAIVLDRHYDRYRRGRRRLADLCGHYGVEIENAHDACDDAIASIRVLYALAARRRELRIGDPATIHRAQIHWHREWAVRYDGWRISEGMIPIDPRDYVWPVAPWAAPAA
jgi:DNA polymerase-3 subunit epsilon